MFHQDINLNCGMGMPTASKYRKGICEKDFEKCPLYLIKEVRSNYIGPETKFCEPVTFL